MVFTLIGMPGCGKSCMGRAISRRLKIKNIDGDRVIEKRYGKRLCELIDEYGTEEFMRMEEESLLSIESEDDFILSTGGSAVYYPRVMEHYKACGKIIYLYCSYEVIEKRLGDFSKRGVVLKPGQTLRDLYEERCALYKKYADIIVDCSGEAYVKYQWRVINSIKYVLDNMKK